MFGTLKKRGNILDEWTMAHSPTRFGVAKFVNNYYVDHFMNAAIFTNVLVMIFEANDTARCVTDEDPVSCRSFVLWYINTGFLILYTVEVSLKAFAFQAQYFKEKVNWVDMFVVITGIATLVLESLELAEGMPSFGALRVVRIIRLAKTLKVLSHFPELLRLVHGFMCAMHAMAWGMLSIGMLLVFFSIVSVELVHPRNIDLIEDGMGSDDPWCREAFGSVQNASLFYFQTLVAGDSWGLCVIPLIQEYPYLLIVFVSALACVQMGFTNLILAVVVDSAAQGRDADREQKQKDKKKAEAEAIAQLYDVIQKCDADDSGEVTLQEMRDAIVRLPEIHKIFDILDIEEADMEEFFCLMDRDGSGTLSYEEFVRSLKKAQLQDPRVQTMLLRLQASQILQKIGKGNEEAQFGRPTDMSFTSSIRNLDEQARDSRRGLQVDPLQRAISSMSSGPLSPTGSCYTFQDQCTMGSVLQASMVAVHVDESFESVLNTLRVDLNQAFAKLENLLWEAKEVPQGNAANGNGHGKSSNSADTEVPQGNAANGNGHGKSSNSADTDPAVQTPTSLIEERLADFIAFEASV